MAKNNANQISIDPNEWNDTQYRSITTINVFEKTSLMSPSTLFAAQKEHRLPYQKLTVQMNTDMTCNVHESLITNVLRYVYVFVYATQFIN